MVRGVVRQMRDFPLLETLSLPRRQLIHNTGQDKNHCWLGLEGNNMNLFAVCKSDV